MLKNDRVAVTLVDVGHSLAVDFNVLKLRVGLDSDHRVRFQLTVWTNPESATVPSGWSATALLDDDLGIHMNEDVCDRCKFISCKSRTGENLVRVRVSPPLHWSSMERLHGTKMYRFN